MSQILIRKGVPKKVLIVLVRNPDVSDDVIVSEIRATPSSCSKLLATWRTDYPNGGKDGEILLSLDDSTKEISETKGFMNIKRSTKGGKLVDVWDEPLEVSFER